MRPRGGRSGWGYVLAMLIGGIVGTVIGQHIPWRWASLPLALGPLRLDLQVVGVRVWAAVNPTGLLGGFLGLLFSLRWL